MTRSLPLHSPYHPTTFLERGVVVQFTTPSLAAARLRANARSGLELIVPSLSGGRGFYILPWGNVHDFCRPTVHDRQIQERTAALRAVSPSAIRRIANEVAIAGYAGREARTIAETSQQQEGQAQVLANFNLLVLLIAEVERREPELQSLRCPDVEQRAKRAIIRSAPQLGLDPEIVAISLEQLASLFKTIGLGPTAAEAAHPRAAARIGALRGDMTYWASTHYGEAAALAEMVRVTADLTLSCASTLIEQARKLADQMTTLLTDWRADPEAVAATLTKPEWLLDGWEPICSIWESAEQTEAGRHTALLEIVQQVPILPKEVGDWIDDGVTYQAANIFRRFTELNKDWRTGLPYLDQIARNEHRRALVS
jgi:hypothetical protein